MELRKAIYQRRAVREFSDAEASGAVVPDLLRVAAQAPSAMNRQPWTFAVFHGRARLAAKERLRHRPGGLHRRPIRNPSFTL
ncbi:nitroreductase family protein [Opitutus sp. GAS368]|uniref:nitroreductase family protein n=1 Tax=Opitutus sp. GAS368 TaxID=1882749 RepID=UPI000879EDF0|nr:nitroreductase family protein [Opitutus sp. GAS368]SDR75708.1 Nitroreductase family protein [Opitutus sp. GAS368]